MSANPEAIVAEADGLQPPPDAGALPEPPAPGTALGRKAATGFMLMSGQSLFTRVLSFVAQMWLARILLKEDFGLFAIALNVQTYANMAQQIGVREVLIARQKRFHLWQNSAFWIAQASGFVSALVIILLSRLVANHYNEPRLVPILLIFALAQPLYNLTLVQEAKVQIDLRFKYAALGTAAQGVVQPVSQVALALMKFGAYALVWPRMIVGAVRCLIYARAAPIRVRRTPQFRAWKYILVPGTMVLLTNLAFTIPSSVPVLVLGSVGPGPKVGQELAGFFYQAFALSMQTLMMLAVQIDAVLFPTLGKMTDDPARLRAALVRAGHALAAIVAPVCALQVVAARPVILLFFSPKDDPMKWEPSVLPFQIMSVGMLFAGALAPGHSLLQAQGRFGTKLWIASAWSAASALVSIVGVWLAPMEYKVAAGAVGMAVGYAGYHTHYCVAGTRPLGGGWSDVVKIIAMPLLVAAIAGAAAALAARLVPAWPDRPRMTYFVQAAVMGCVGFAVYVAGLRLLAPGVWNDLLHAAEPVLRRLGIRRKTA
jgi:PST family polysaccharide transporter